jgi:hypothetical protein
MACLTSGPFQTSNNPGIGWGYTFWVIRGSFKEGLINNEFHHVVIRSIIVYCKVRKKLAGGSAIGFVSYKAIMDSAEEHNIQYNVIGVYRNGSTNDHPILLLYHVNGIKFGDEQIYTFHIIRYPNTSFPQSVFTHIAHPLPGLPIRKINVRYGAEERTHKTYIHSMDRCITLTDGNVIPIITMTDGYHCLGKEYWHAHDPAYAMYRYIPRPSTESGRVTPRMFPKEGGYPMASRDNLGCTCARCISGRGRGLLTVTPPTNLTAEPTFENVPQRIINSFIENAETKQEFCAITMEPIQREECIVTPCWHLFQKEAFLEWIGRQKACPACHARCSVEKLMKYVV